MSKRPKILARRPAGPEHMVVSVRAVDKEKFSHRKEPCPKCPWRIDAVGEFPAEAFKHSAETTYDMSQHLFSCHDSGVKKPAVCAGFLLRGADHNLSVRLAYMSGLYKGEVQDGGHELHSSYKDMAVANGVSPDDPVLAKCR